MAALKTNVLIWERLWLHRWKPPFILTRIIWRTWRSTWTRTFSEIQSSFNITQNLILEHSEEILNVNTVDSALLHGQDRYCLTIKWFNGQRQKVRVYSDSVLCQVKMCANKDSFERWEGQVEEFKMSPSYKELLGIDGEAIEFEWNIFPGFSTLQILQKNQGWFAREEHRPRKIHRPDHLHVNVCSMTSIGQRKEMIEFVFRIQIKSRITRRDSCKDTGRFRVLERKRSGMELFLAHLREIEIPQPISWWKDSRTQVTQSSQVPVLRIVEFWERWKEKKPCTSMRILQTQNSCSEPFILWIGSAFTEQFRIGVNSSAWQRKKRNKRSHKNPWPKMH